MDEMLLASSFLVHYGKPEMSSNVYFLIGSHILFSGKLNFNVTKKTWPVLYRKLYYCVVGWVVGTCIDVWISIILIPRHYQEQAYDYNNAILFNAVCKNALIL